MLIKKIKNKLNNGVSINKNTITVYYAPYALLELENQQVLLDVKPVSLMSEIHKRKNTSSGSFMTGEYQACTALHELAKNIFVLKCPFDANVELEEDGRIKSTNRPGWFIERNSTINENKCVDIDLSYLFFCDESLDMSFTPPYMHKTQQHKYGFIASVKYNIGYWFRPTISVFQLWDNINEIKINENEPFAYLHFHTNKKIKLKEFKLTSEVLNLTNTCVRHKYIIPFQSLEKLYDRFVRTGMRKRVLAEIKKNTIE
jgi:hypothetical protein